MNSPLEKKQLLMIVAYNQQGVIGRRNALAWQLPADLAHFKKTTMGHPIIMGRKTWESLGRALPGRKNIVITRDSHYQAKDAHIVHSLAEAISLANAEEPSKAAFIIGGEQIYRLALPLVQRIYATEVKLGVADGDAFFPQLNPKQWKEVDRQTQEPYHGISFDFVIYDKI